MPQDLPQNQPDVFSLSPDLPLHSISPEISRDPLPSITALVSLTRKKEKKSRSVFFDLLSLTKELSFAYGESDNRSPKSPVLLLPLMANMHEQPVNDEHIGCLHGDFFGCESACVGTRGE